MATVEVDWKFPGGNGIIDVTDEGVYVRPDLRDTPNWFYWHVRLRGAAGTTVNMFATHLGVRGPAVSFDRGVSWQWLGADVLEKVDRWRKFVLPIPLGADDVRVSMEIPYLQANLDAFLAENAGDCLTHDVLCQTEKGRDVELLRFGCLQGDPRKRVFLTARHHACESMANYVLEGIITEVLSHTDAGGWLRENVHFTAVPFVDKDGVEEGDQGKSRQPFDHSLDYGEAGLYAVSGPIKNLVRSLGAKGLDMALDLHCPGLRGHYHEVVLFPVHDKTTDNWPRLRQYLQVLETVQQGPLPFLLAETDSFEGWTSQTKASVSKEEADPAMRKLWDWILSEFPGTTAGVLEMPYANASGEVVTADSARLFGRDMARALAKLYR